MSAAKPFNIPKTLVAAAFRAAHRQGGRRPNRTSVTLTQHQASPRKRGKSNQLVLWVSTAVVVIATALPGVDLQTRFAKPFPLMLSKTIGVMVTDGRSTLQRYEANQGYGSNEVAFPLSKSESSEWIELSSLTAAKIIRLQGQATVVAFGFRNAHTEFGEADQ